jgi:hypothetical protein
VASVKSVVKAFGCGSAALGFSWLPKRTTKTTNDTKKRSPSPRWGFPVRAVPVTPD